MENRDNFICFKCKHRRFISGGCDAFPFDIPDEILLSNQHSEPLSSQDNDIVFEEGEKQYI